MKKSRFTEEQIATMLNENRAGVSTVDVCRKYGVSTKTFYGWRARYGGLVTSEVRRMKALEEENSKLKRPEQRRIYRLRETVQHQPN